MYPDASVQNRDQHKPPPLFSTEISFQTDQNLLNCRVYTKHFYSDQAFIPIVCVRVNAARVNTLVSCAGAADELPERGCYARVRDESKAI